MEPQLVVKGRAGRVRVSASEGAQHGAYRRGLRDLSPGSRGPTMERESGPGREPSVTPTA